MSGRENLFSTWFEFHVYKGQSLSIASVAKQAYKKRRVFQKHSSNQNIQASNYNGYLLICVIIVPRAIIQSTRLYII